MKEPATDDFIQMLNLDKMINDLLEILAVLDGRVKRVELKLHIKKRPSYLKVVGNEESTSLSDDIRIAQTKHKLDLLNTAIGALLARVEALETNI
jgi:DNA polymerase III delta prime subunit